MHVSLAAGSNNSAANGKGITNSLFASSVIQSLQLNGITGLDSNDNTIAGNRIEDSGNHGIYLSYIYGSSTGVRIRRNAVSGNIITRSAGHGVYLQKATRNAISSNSIYSSTLQGIYEDSTSTANIMDSNSIFASVGSGLYLLGSSNIVSRNYVFENSTTGSAI